MYSLTVEWVVGSYVRSLTVEWVCSVPPICSLVPTSTTLVDNRVDIRDPPPPPEHGIVAFCVKTSYVNVPGSAGAGGGG